MAHYHFRSLITALGLLTLSGCAQYHSEEEVKTYNGDLTGQVYARFLGTSTLYFGIGKEGYDDGVMIDGFVSRPGFFRMAFLPEGMKTDPVKVESELAKAGLTFGEIDSLFVSHSHYDHALDALAYKDATVYGSCTTAQTICSVLGDTENACKDDNKVNKNCPSSDKKFDRLWPDFERLTFSDDPIETAGFKVWAVPGEHGTKPWALQGLQHLLDRMATYGKYYADHGPVYSFYLERGDIRILVVPSAGYPDQYPDFVKPNIVFLGIGVLSSWVEKRPENPAPFDSASYAEILWRKNVEELGANVVIPIHWDSFNYALSDELRLTNETADNVGETLEFLKKQASESKNDVKLLLPPIRKPFLLNDLH